MKKNIYFFIVGVLAALFIAGCSDLQNEKAPTQTVAKIHGENFADATSQNSHKVYLREHQWNLQTCKQCHGSSYNGGTANVSCLSCHNKPSGPENCVTCHGGVNAAPPEDLSGNIVRSSRGVGAHQAHLSNGVSCNSCHVVPAAFTSEGHLGSDGKAEVRFDTVTFFGTNQIYNSTNGTCSNNYCHGNFKNGNGNVTVTWTDETGNAAQCGTCHGDVTKTTLEEKAFPKTGHPNIGTTKCNQCHGRTVDANMNIISTTYHINGKVD